MWLNEYSEQFLPIAGLLALRLLVGVGSWLAAKFGKKKKSRMEEMAEQVSPARHARQRHAQSSAIGPVCDTSTPRSAQSAMLNFTTNVCDAHWAVLVIC